MAKKETFTVSDVRFEGKQIIIPEGMDYDKAIKWIATAKEESNRVINVHHQLEGYPLDCIMALHRAMKAIYGFTSIKGRESWFGEAPPNFIDVSLPNGKHEAAPMGRIMPPAWNGGYVDVEFDEERLSISVRGQIKAKDENKVRAVIDLAKDELKVRSIYRGQAIRVDLGWMSGRSAFHPRDSSPTFMDINIDPDNLILNEGPAFDLQTNIWTLIEKSQDCRQLGIPLKHGLILGGPYGTGKTLTAKVTALKAHQNGWSFIYLQDARDVAQGLRLASLYSPAVLFVEDIDTVTSGNRSNALNEVLNTLDGVDTKSDEIITIFTTNRLELIHPSVLRAGRVDTLINLGSPDATAAVRFLQFYGDKWLNKAQDWKKAGESLAGMIPAFIAETINKAKRYAIGREGSDILGKVVLSDVLKAADSMKRHIDMAEDKKQLSPEQQYSKDRLNAFNYEVTKRKELPSPAKA